MFLGLCSIISRSCISEIQLSKFRWASLGAARIVVALLDAPHERNKATFVPTAPSNASLPEATESAAWSGAALRGWPEQSELALRVARVVWTWCDRSASELSWMLNPATGATAPDARPSVNVLDGALGRARILDVTAQTLSEAGPGSLLLDDRRDTTLSCSPHQARQARSACGTRQDDAGVGLGSKERPTRTDDVRLRYELKRAWKDGTRAVGRCRHPAGGRRRARRARARRRQLRSAKALPAWTTRAELFTLGPPRALPPLPTRIRR